MQAIKPVDETIYRNEAAYEALGFLSSLYANGEVPECLRDIAREILEKAGEERTQS